MIHERWPSRSQRGIRIAKWVLFTCRLGVLAKRGFTQTQRPTHRENWARPVHAVGNVPSASGPAKGGKPVDLGQHEVVGPGLLHRIINEIQRALAAKTHCGHGGE